MSISKKLLIIASLLLGLQLNIGSYYNDYKTAELKAEITSILDFMDTLRQENTETAQTLVTQLEKEFKDVEEKYEWNRCSLDNIDIIDMARIITKNETMDAKITEISAILTLKEAAKQLHIKKEAERQYKWMMIHIATVVSMLGLFATITATEYYFFPTRMTNLPVEA